MLYTKKSYKQLKFNSWNQNLFRELFCKWQRLPSTSINHLTMLKKKYIIKGVKMVVTYRCVPIMHMEANFKSDLACQDLMMSLRHHHLVLEKLWKIFFTIAFKPRAKKIPLIYSLKSSPYTCLTNFEFPKIANAATTQSHDFLKVKLSVLLQHIFC